MTDQIPMADLLNAVDDDWHQARAVRPSWFVDCEGCDRRALINSDTPRPWLCGYCKAEKGNE